MSAVHAEVEESEDIRIPKPIIVAAISMVVFVILISAVARMRGMAVGGDPGSTVISERAMQFSDRADGAVVVTLPPAGDTLAVLLPGSNGFVRGALRAFVRERRLRSLGPEVPFVVKRWASGAVTLEDPATGEQVELGAFGPTNRDAFARLLDLRRTAIAAPHP